MGTINESINEAAIRSVVEQIVAQIKGTQGLPAPVAPSRNGTGAAGVHATVDDAVAAASEAFKKFQRCSMDERQLAIGKIRSICISQKEVLGPRELDETKIGRRDHKIGKLQVAGEKTPGIEFLRTDAYSGDKGLAVTEYAPFGVIGAITPVTHSLPTLASNAISMLAGGNTVVFNAHPSGADIAKHGVRIFNEAMREAIGIDNLINIIDPPSIESAQAIFDHPQVRLLVVTGGPAVARAALQSKKRAIVAGPGNPPVVVDETADIVNAAKSIVAGCAFDNNLLCIGEKEVFVVHSIFEQLMSSMGRFGGYRLTDSQIRQLEGVAFEKGSDGKIHLRKDLVGKDPSVLADSIGLKIPSGVEILYGETGESSPFVDHEQMMPFLPIVRTQDVDSAIALAKKYEHGYRHTAILHSRNTDVMSRMGRELDVSVFVVNGPSMAGLGLGGEGYLSFSIATPTGEGVTSPLTFTRQRRSAVNGSMRFI